MSLILDSNIEECNGASGLYISKILNSAGDILWEAYAIGTVTNFEYTGNIEEFEAPAAGMYKLEVWGAKGGDGNGTGGKGGYSNGYVYLNKGQTIYICCGGAGVKTTGTANGGYNGGGKGIVGDVNYSKNCGSGGGATHIAKRTGLLSSLSSYKSDILIVAGGGGGAGGRDSSVGTLNGGTGGGTNGGSGTYTSEYFLCGTGGSQSAGGGSTDYFGGIGSFGKGGSPAGYPGAGGGGGLYGGGSGHYYNGASSAGGGSGYIGGVSSGSTRNGENNGNGKAAITYVSRDSEIHLDVTPYYVQFLSYPLTKVTSHSDDGTGAVSTTSSGYTISVKKNPDTNSYGYIKGSVSLATQNCNKVRIKYTTGGGSYTEALINGVSVYGTGSLEFACSGSTFILNMEEYESTAAYNATLTITEIYFYYG